MANIPFQNIKEGASSIGQVQKLMVFLEKYLPEFPKGRSLRKSSEEDISQDLYKYLQRKQSYNDEKIEYPFQFQPETIQRQKSIKGHKRRADIGVRINTRDIDMELIYCIEAKKLPTAKSGNDREKEYVLGNYGGINRFKQNLHGLNDSGDLLSENGVIGYVQADDFTHWHTQINSWINAEWGDNELLKKVYFNTIGKLESNHSRLSGGQVKLTHYWIIME